MSIRVALNHRTSYQFDRPVLMGPQSIRLRPAPHCRTPIQSYSLRVDPCDHFLNWQQDPSGNYVARIVFPDRIERLDVNVDLIAELTVINPFDFFLEPDAVETPIAYRETLAEELAPYLKCERPGPMMNQWLASIDQSPRPTIDFMVELNERLQETIKYAVRMEPGLQTCEETLERRVGSCRDSALLLMHVLRHLGMASRFTSGYLIQLKPDEEPLDRSSGTHEDFTDLHAWTEVYLPGGGWIGLDATSGMLAGEGHIPLACTPNPVSAAPVAGTCEPCETTFQHTMSMDRIYETPRVANPYTDTQWKSVRKMGHQIDRCLAESNISLAVGGQPTFRTVDDSPCNSSHGTVLRSTTHRAACALMNRLFHRFGKGGVLHHVTHAPVDDDEHRQWSMHCIWRRDGEPLWQSPELFVDSFSDANGSSEQADLFTAALAARIDRISDRAVAIAANPSRDAHSDGSYRQTLLSTHTESPSRRRHGAHACDPNTSCGTVVSVEWVEDCLLVSLPQFDLLDDYIEVVSAIEKASIASSMPIALGGCLPPEDARLQIISLSPESGSIRVRMPAAMEWNQIVQFSDGVYQEARRSRLTAEQFELDGCHTVTGGGHHVVVDVPALATSAVARTPEWLSSLTEFWHNHPALFYLFGRPTAGLSRPMQGADPFHRIASRAATANRPGSVVIEAFETPPHYRMSLTQQLLVHALFARFWQYPVNPAPTGGRSIRPERLMLPYFLWKDFESVIKDLQDHGYAFDADWFAPHFEFRFPKIGETSWGDIHVELRQAIELRDAAPRESKGANGRALAHASAGRLQVRVRGITDTRHELACNRRRVPLEPTEREGEFVAGIRFSSATPEPLVLDLVDSWMGRSVGGCQYHIGDPNGIAPCDYPVNANEAESRRSARFLSFGHTPGPLEILLDATEAADPFTLDLCRDHVASRI